MALVTNIEVSFDTGPVTVQIGEIAVVVRRIGERIITLGIEADRSIPIGFDPDTRRRVLRD